MKIKKVLLLYKRSAYNIYFMDRNSSMRISKNQVIQRESKKFKEAHARHYETLKSISRVLFTYGIRFDEAYRGSRINYKKYDLVITVGGDGTFLEAARNLTNQIIFGINSAPGFSVGRFCIATSTNFESIFRKILIKDYKIRHLERLRVTFNNKETIDALNDVLVSHPNPAMLSRYSLAIGRVKEIHRSSGVWISTPAGSTGAIKSAGGVVLNQYARAFQYKPRELYAARSSHYQLKGRILKSNEHIMITSLMRRGMVYVDGAHQQHQFNFGSSIKIGLSPYPIRTIDVS